MAGVPIESPLARVVDLLMTRAPAEPARAREQITVFTGGMWISGRLIAVKSDGCSHGLMIQQLEFMPLFVHRELISGIVMAQTDTCIYLCSCAAIELALEDQATFASFCT
jgi:hypothetical protein